MWNWTWKWWCFVQCSSTNFRHHLLTYHLIQGWTEFKGIQELGWEKYDIFSFASLKLKFSISFH